VTPPPRPSLLERLRDPSERLLGALLLAPTFALLALIVAYPIGRLLWNSLFDLRLTGGGVPRFIGLENYQLVFTDPDFWNATKNTLLITRGDGAGRAGGGAGAGAAGQPAVQAPLAGAAGAAAALGAAAVVCGADLCVVLPHRVRRGQRRAAAPGPAEPRDPTMWLLKPGWAFAAICLTIIWKTSSFMALILLAGLQMIPRTLYEAAEVDGASPWQQFWQITIPMLMPSIVVALIFRTITALQTFDIPYTMTKGGPGNATETLAMLIHKTTIDYLDVGYGSALAVCMFVLSMVVTAVYLRQVGRQAA
jgi:ABC-type sugar transport system permease subunit